MNGVPFEWVAGIFALIIILIIAVTVIRLRTKKNEKPEVTGEEQNLVALNAVDQNGNPVMGKLLANVILTDKDMIIEDPSIIDEATEKPKQIRASYQDVMPLNLRDENNNMISLWGVLKMQGEYVLYSFNDLAKRVRQRFDPLEADVREVGQHFIGGPPRMGGLPQILQSTTGKVLLFGGAVCIGMFFMFFLVVVSGHWH